MRMCVCVWCVCVCVCIEEGQADKEAHIQYRYIYLAILRLKAAGCLVEERGREEDTLHPGVNLAMFDQGCQVWPF